jgi:DNA-binding CsgD family transcriptional regulator/PAS domain-containing protein
MPTGDDLLAAIDAVHAAGVDTELWQEALKAIALAVGGEAASLEIFDKRTWAHREAHLFGLPPAQELEYLSHYAPLNPRLPFVARQQAGELGWDYKYFDEARLKRDPFYAEFLPRTGVRYFVNGTIVSNADNYGAVVVHRSAKRGHAGRQDIALMQRIVPHVRRAFDVSRRLREAGEVRSSFERALDLLADGVALVRGDGAVLYSNEALQTIARQNDGVRLRQDGIELSSAEARGKLNAALSVIARMRAGELDVRAASDFLLPRPSNRPAYLISVFALRRSPRENEKQGADAIIFIRDPLRRGTTPDRALRELFGLTDAEAGVAQTLQAGIALGQYAQTHGISLNTIYTHLRHVREKTGCRSVADLVRKLAEFQLTLRRD